MIAIGKLWGDAEFAWRSPLSKLLYLYLCTQPSISTLGVLQIGKDKICLDLKIDEGALDEAIEELLRKDYFKLIEEENFLVFIIKAHFESLPKSKTTVRKAKLEGGSSRYREQLLEIYTKDDIEQKSGDFIPPTPQEVTEYALSLGYVINGARFVEYYGDNDWHDKNDKKVRNWKAKLRAVWCRDDNKLEKVPGAPKGFEYFYIEPEEGHRVYPESWKKGRPSHSNFMYAELLNAKFTEVTNV